jgi:hypothetical protein
LQIISTFANREEQQILYDTMKQNFFRLTVILLILAGVITACGKKDDKVTDNIFTFIDFDPNAEISIAMVDIYYESSRILQLICQTKRQYPNTCYWMDVEYGPASSVINIELKGVINGGNVCGLAPTNAQAVINLKALENGTYNLNITVGEKKFTGELVVTTDSYKVNINDNPEFYFVNASLNKIPEHTIWGFISYNEEEEIIEEDEEENGEENDIKDDEEEIIHPVEAFFNALTELGVEIKNYLPGLYSAFYIDENGDINQDDIGEYDFTQQFIFHYEGKIDELEKLVKEYATTYKRQFDIAIYTSTGKTFLSWKY